MINQQIQNYKIISLIGEGGMASVYKAEHIILGHFVAIKILKIDFTKHSNIRGRFKSEARNLVKLNHDNIIRVIDFIDAGDIVASILEYIPGESLEEYILKNGPLKNHIIDNLFKQMCNAVEYVHKQGLIHRDIKPSNFMVTTDGAIKLLDFGIAKNLNDGAVDYTKTSMAQQMGTPMYMSPEQVRNISEITQYTDIYSLGVVLWQMVMNKKPYDANTLTLPEIQVEILNNPLSKTETIYDLIIQNLTRKNPDTRVLSGYKPDPLNDTVLDSTIIIDAPSIEEIETTIFIDNLEIMKKDLGKMDWYQAVKKCNEIGDGWRLPNKSELNFLFNNKEIIGEFENYYYWSIDEFNTYTSYEKYFLNGNEGTTDKPNYLYVRPVKNIEI